MKSLLVDRFKLKTHMETRDLPIYALIVARSDGKLGPDIKPSTPTVRERPKRRSAPRTRQGRPRGIASMLAKPGETINCAIMPAINPSSPSGGFGLRGNGQAMTMLTQLLTQVTGRTVIDKTALTGLDDGSCGSIPQVFIASMAQQAGINIPAGFRQSANASPTARHSLTALHEQLGLKLDSQKGPVEVLVIDSAELPQPD